MEIQEEQLNKIVKMVKSKAGISISVRDEYISNIVQGVISELVEINGIRDLDVENRIGDFILVVDYAEFRYSSRGEGGFFEYRAPNGEEANVLPQHLAWRIKNRRLMVGRIGENNG